MEEQLHQTHHNSKKLVIIIIFLVITTLLSLIGMTIAVISYNRNPVVKEVEKVVYVEVTAIPEIINTISPSRSASNSNIDEMLKFDGQVQSEVNGQDDISFSYFPKWIIKQAEGNLSLINNNYSIFITQVPEGWNCIFDDSVNNEFNEFKMGKNYTVIKGISEFRRSNIPLLEDNWTYYLCVNNKGVFNTSTENFISIMYYVPENPNIDIIYEMDEIIKTLSLK